MNKSPSKTDVLDLYFVENRAKVLDLAAFIDRFGRAEGPAAVASDPRWIGMTKALSVLVDQAGEKARRILELWSDPSQAPIDRAEGKGAIGVWPGLR